MKAPDDTPDRLARQIGFILEVERLKQVFRQTYLLDRSRKENDAEHSWQVALMAAVLAEHADEPVDVARVIRMMLVHDLVEIDAGDTFMYDTQARASQAQREQQAAERIFALLPDDQAAEFRRLWDEFEARQTPEARFAAALDRLQPLLNNYYTQGSTWREHGVRFTAAWEVNSRIAKGSQSLWQLAKQLLNQSLAAGHLLRDDE